MGSHIDSDVSTVPDAVEELQLLHNFVWSTRSILNTLLAPARVCVKRSIIYTDGSNGPPNVFSMYGSVTKMHIALLCSRHICQGACKLMVLCNGDPLGSNREPAYAEVRDL